MGKKFEPGFDPRRNPGGRPKAVKEVVDLARKRTVKAIRRLTELVDSEDGQVAVAACKTLLERGWGKVPQTVNMSISQKNPRQLTDEELDAKIAELEAQEASH